VGAPYEVNFTLLTRKDNHFGDMVVFNDSITLNNNFHSPLMGKDQGFYFYEIKNTFNSYPGIILRMEIYLKM
jgi:hypothetical protein